jgi:hypothetical protein
MANVKKVWIEGWMPFTVGEDDAALKELGHLNAPSWGLDITYGGTIMVPNANGGQTAHYHFTVAGTEAVSWESIERTIDVFQKVGTVVTLVKASDVEDGRVSTPHVLLNLKNDLDAERAVKAALRAQGAARSVRTLAESAK